MELTFRPLRADEIECRVGTVKEGKGVSLLLYKDARCDMNVLDETVGAMNWQKSYSRENANCTVSIWDADKGIWVSKEDTGTESRTEAEKGLASDSFKRACFNWGIGRELYTAPFIWMQGAGKYDRFWVKEMDVEGKKITRLVIYSCDQYGNRVDDEKYLAYIYPRTAQNAAGAKKKAKGGKTSADDAKAQEKPPTAQEKAYAAYPPREEMERRLAESLREDVMQKWLDMWGVTALPEVKEVEKIMGMYNYYSQKGAFDAVHD